MTTAKIVLRLLEDVAAKFETDKQMDRAFVRGYKAAIEAYRDFHDFAERLEGRPNQLTKEPQ